MNPLSTHTVQTQSPYFGKASNGQANNSNGNFSFPGKKTFEHSTHDYGTGNEDEGYSFGCKERVANQGRRTPGGLHHETPRSLSPLYDDLDILSQAHGVRAEAREALYPGRMPSQAEAEGLSIKIPLLTSNRESPEPAKRIAQAMYWEKPTTIFETFTTHFRSIDDLEYPANDMGQKKTVLSCADGPPKTGETHVASHINWLHLEGSTMSLEIFYNLIMSCPLIDDEKKTVSIKLVDKVREQFLRYSENGPYIEPGSVLRGVGTYPQAYAASLSEKYHPVAPVVFVASPYLKVSPLKEHWSSGNKQEHYPRTLLQNFYGFDVAPNRDKAQIIRKIFRGKQPNDALHVNQMWCLLIGSNVLITMSDRTSEELLAGAIEKRPADQEPPIKIKIIDDDKNTYHDIAISSNTTWVDLFNITMDVVQKKRSEFSYYDLRYLETETLTAERWIEIVKSRKTQSHAFRLTRKSSTPMKLLGYSGSDIGSIPTKRQHSGESSHTAGPVKKETEMRDPSSQKSSKVITSPEMSKKFHLPIDERSETEEGNSPLELRIQNNVDGVKRSSPDPQNSMGADTSKHTNLHGYLKPEVTSIPSSSKEGSLYTGEDSPTWQVHDDTASRMMARHNSEEGDPYVNSKYTPLQNLQPQDNEAPGDTTFGTTPLGISAPSTPGPFTEGSAITEGVPSQYYGDKSGNASERQNGHGFHGNGSAAVDDLTSSESDDEKSVHPRNKGFGQIHLANQGCNGHNISPGASFEVLSMADEPKVSNDGSSKQKCTYTRQSQPSLPSTTDYSINHDHGPAYSTSFNHQSNYAHHGARDLNTTYHNAMLTRSPDIVRNDRTRPLRRATEGRNQNAANKSHPRYTRRSLIPTDETSPATSANSVKIRYPAGRAPGLKLPRIVPFFLWGPSIPISSRAPQFAKEEEMIELLDEMHKMISVSPLGRRYYLKISEFTEREFFSRHEFLIGSPLQEGHSRDGSSQLQTDPKKNGEEKRCSVASQDLANDKNENNSAIKSLQSHQEPVYTTNGAPGNNNAKEKITSTQEGDEPAMKQEQSLCIPIYDKTLAELVEVVCQITGSFTPRIGSPATHGLLKSFWGCMDIICRQLKWEENERDPHEAHTYVVRDFTHQLAGTAVNKPASSQKTPWFDCRECKFGEEYNSAEEALNHIHNKHLECEYERQHKCKRPYDDPCYVWLHRIWIRRPTQTAGDDLLANIKSFISDLHEIQERITELHAMVTSKEDDLMKDMVIRPLLPRDISSALHHIVRIFVFRSKILSLMTRQKYSSEDLFKRISEKIKELQQFEEKSQEWTISLLDRAKRDIFLSGNTSGDIERRQPQAVGAESLALAFICKGQNLLFESKSTSHHQHENPIRLYKRYSSKLHFQANQRPQKRVFLDIHDLEEELDALSALLNQQKDCLDQFMMCISPDTLQLAAATRVTQNKVETIYKESHSRQLETRVQEIENMKIRSRVLKEQVKQTIEILEEDHGKAIRVFTIVTLFFLPLSFVSSFLGMNTADVRNMHHKQGLFWVTGIPVTLLVLTIACIYGYKGDEIRDWMIQRSHFPSKKVSRLDLEWDYDEGNYSYTRHNKRHLRAGLESRTRGGSAEQKDGNSQIDRKATLDSLALFQQSSRNEEV